jgi:hypothetical protein
MKRSLVITITLLCLFAVQHSVSAQEHYGKTLNLGIGVGGYAGYSRYAGHSLPVFNINYEFDVARNFTLAPSVSFYTYSNNYYWSNDYYSYSEIVIPVGVKGSYYFDELFDAGNAWDFYAAGSLGVAIVNATWDARYQGDRDHFHSGSSIFLDIHAGAEYHFSSKLGVFLDLSTGVSTVGLALHSSK